MSARQIQWDTPQQESVREHYDDLYFLKKAPETGSIITARYKGHNVRLKVLERADSKTSIAEVIGIGASDPDEQTLDLGKGDTVLIPDDKRAFVVNDDEDDD